MTSTQAPPDYAVVDGVRIWFAESGLDDAPCVVLIHGNGANHSWWSLMLDDLESRYHIVQIDLSGHGESDHHAGGRYSVSTWAHEISEVVRSLGREVVLVAHSMGGGIALAVAAEIPDLVRGVVAFDTIIALDAPTTKSTGPLGTQRYYQDRESILARFRLSPPQPHPPAEIMEKIALASIRQTPDGWTWKADQTRDIFFDRQDSREMLAELTCPVLFVNGELSHLGSPDPQGLLAAVKDGELVVVEGVHHHLVLEDPDECTRLVVGFVDRIERSRS